MTTTTLTIAQVCDAIQADTGAFAADLTIPVTGEQAQGDLYILAADGQVPPATRALPAGGETVLTGRGGHAHVLAGLGVGWAPSDRLGAQTLGVLTVPDGCVGYLFHAPVGSPRRLGEHAPNAIAPGTYVIRRQREQADEIRLVAD